jgi:hypothetical protein
MHIPVDSTGLQVYGAGQWLDEKHGARCRRGRRKLHLAVDADGGEIIAHTMTDQDTGDASQVTPLLDQIDAPIRQFTADGAYDGKPTHDAIINRNTDALIVIPPRKRGQTGWQQISWPKESAYCAIQRDGRMK